MEETLGARIKLAREAAGMNRPTLGRALAEKGGEPVSRQRIEGWENDDYDPPTTMLRRLADVLECDSDWLLGSENGSAEPRRISAYRQWLRELEQGDG